MFFLTANTSQEVYKFILADKSYEEILQKFFSKKSERDEFRQYLWLIICEQGEEKIVTSWNSKFFKYWYVSVIKNQVASATSPWHLKERARNHNIDEIDGLNEPGEYGITYEDIDNQNYNNMRLELVEKAIQYWSAKDPFFLTERECFNLYYQEGLSYRQISKKLNIPTPSVYIYVNAAQVKIKGYITNKRYNK